MIFIKTETLVRILSKMLGTEIASASHNVTELQGGTVGDVQLIEGIAETAVDDKYPYKIVLKTQEKWERFGDPDSWRREYDLYISGLDEILPDTIRWPKCYHAEINGDEIQIWMKYVDGASGNDLTPEMLEQAAFELGRFQGMLHSQPELLQNISNLSDTRYLRRDYEQWHTQAYSFEQIISYGSLPEYRKQALRDGRLKLLEGKSFEYSFLRSEVCDIPQHLKQMIFDIDDNMENLFKEIASLPIVLCHRDFWIENVIYDNGKIRLIDWDTVGWGYLGEDLASLVSDDIDYDYFETLCERLIPAYYRGIAEYMDISGVGNKFIREMILLKSGYRKVQGCLFAETVDDRDEMVRELQKIYSKFII